jgi:hypothetical protein
MTRTVQALLIFALAPFLLGGGGSPPPDPVQPGTTIVGPRVEGILVMDPQETMTGDLAKHASLYLRYRRWFQPDPIAATVFTLPDNFQLLKGCDPAFSELRFVYSQNRRNGLDTFMKESGFITPVFADLGITVTPKMRAVITRIKKQGCTTGGSVPGLPNAPTSEAKKGMLWMVVQIEFELEP